MPKTIAIGILGLGRIGTSVGLALKRRNADKDSPQQFVITGYDTAPAAAESARKRGALDSVARQPDSAAANQDIVVLTLPHGETAGAYRAISGALRPGAVILDAGLLKQPSSEAAQALPPAVHAVGVTPILNPAYLFDGRDAAEYAAADLFDKGAWLIAPDARSAGDAIELASDFALLVGATPLFVDPVELDAWTTSVEIMPALLGFAAFYSLLRADGWENAQRAGNPAFARLTHHLYDVHPDDLRDLLVANRLGVVQSLDRLIETLTVLRGAVAKNDKHTLEAALVESSEQYSTWINRRTRGEWGDNPIQNAGQPDRRDMIMSGLFGTAIAKRLKRDGKS
jgi:prephenate dehydrogenase